MSNQFSGELFLSNKSTPVDSKDDLTDETWRSTLEQEMTAFWADPKGSVVSITVKFKQTDSLTNLKDWPKQAYGPCGKVLYIRQHSQI